jgi:hypothetical protein
MPLRVLAQLLSEHQNIEISVDNPRTHHPAWSKVTSSSDTDIMASSRRTSHHVACRHFEEGRGRRHRRRRSSWSPPSGSHAPSKAAVVPRGLRRTEGMRPHHHKPSWPAGGRWDAGGASFSSCSSFRNDGPPSLDTSPRIPVRVPVVVAVPNVADWCPRPPLRTYS